MDKLSLLTFVVNGIAWLISLFRICTSQGKAFDYVVVFLSFGILVYDIYEIIKIHLKNKVKNKNSTEDCSVC